MMMIDVPSRFSAALVLVVIMNWNLRGIEASTQSKLFRAWEEEVCMMDVLVCNGPLGMMNGEIRDWQITASSALWDSDCHEKHARLYQPADRAWCARQKSDSEWLQIDLGIAARVSGRRS